MCESGNIANRILKMEQNQVAWDFAFATLRQYSSEEIELFKKENGIHLPILAFEEEFLKSMSTKEVLHFEKTLDQKAVTFNQGWITSNLLPVQSFLKSELPLQR